VPFSSINKIDLPSANITVVKITTALQNGGLTPEIGLGKPSASGVRYQRNRNRSSAGMMLLQIGINGVEGRVRLHPRAR